MPPVRRKAGPEIAQMDQLCCRFVTKKIRFAAMNRGGKPGVQMRIKGLFLAGAAVAGGLPIGMASAADLPARMPVKAPLVAPPAPATWTGFYLGANIGAAWAQSSVGDELGVGVGPWMIGTTTSANKTGLIGGVEAGFNWQVSSLVLGIEADISFAALDRSVVVTGGTGAGRDTYSSRLSDLATVRGRLGWAIDRALIYGTGGVAFANLNDTLTDPLFPFTASPSSSVTGWTAGGGIEYALVDHWTVKAEYLHVAFPTRNTFDSNNTYAFAFKDSLDIGRAGINFKF
jgi:outer membrane immunogenic protein